MTTPLSGIHEGVLEGLDPEQRQIAEHLRGPIVVLAGAGTGKTRALTHRIAHGVQVGAYAPEKVMAVTFTRKAAGEMQARLQGLGASGVRATTFHSAALAQLSYFWPLVIGGSAPKLVNSKVPLISQAAEELSIHLTNETVRDIAAEIEWRKVSMFNIDRYMELFAGDQPLRHAPAGVSPEQLMDIHTRYAQLLEERKQMDFEDVLLLTTGMLQTEPRAAHQVHERYRFFTVDEYQDVSPLQHALLSEWLGERDDLCVVGDASQTIYSFAGAKSTYLLRFAHEFDHATEYRLERNYRSEPEIVATANRLMLGRPGALTLQPQRSASSRDAMTVSAEWFVDERDEAEAVAEAIAQQIQQGTLASNIAILYRSNAQAAVVETALGDLGISFRVLGAQRFFDRAEIRQAVMLIRGQAKVSDDRPLFHIVSDVLRPLGLTAAPPQGALAREQWDALHALLRLVDEQPPTATIQSFSEELLRRSHVHHEPTLEAVTLAAVHASKGLEWPVVYLIGMSESVFPSSYATTDEAVEEERRLAYVAITRAQDLLRISGTSRAGRSTRQPSRFIAEAGVPFTGA